MELSERETRVGSAIGGVVRALAESTNSAKRLSRVERALTESMKGSRYTFRALGERSQCTLLMRLDTRFGSPIAYITWVGIPMTLCSIGNSGTDPAPLDVVIPITQYM